MTVAFYNEHDPHAAAWLRELMADGLIPNGDVDERSIKDVAATDVRGFGRQHYFAGIGGWELALQLAGWPDDRPVWTGSCPCQPYSAAGKQKGNADERDLWPDFFRLIRECRPECVFGEQVEGAIKHGWLDRVHADMEGEGYAVGSCVLGAHSVGAPHIRQRLYWVAHLPSQGRFDRGAGEASQRRADEPERLRPISGLADAGRDGVRVPGRGSDGEEAGGGESSDRRGERVWTDVEPKCESVARGVFHPASNRRESRRAEPNGPDADSTRNASRVDDSTSERTGISSAAESGSNGSHDGLFVASSTSVADGVAQGDAIGNRPQGQHETGAAPGAVVGADRGFWADSYLIACRDGKARRVPTEPLLFPLADGVPGRVGLLRGAGNAICVPTAAEFIKAFLGTKG